MPKVRYVARMTQCRCGHTAIEHYDSYLFCTYTLGGQCDCEQFEAAEEESCIDIGEGWEENPPLEGGSRQGPLTYMLFDDAGNAINSYDNEDTAKQALRAMVRREPEAAERILLISYDENGNVSEGGHE
jgi:hypothetical protein